MTRIGLRRQLRGALAAGLAGTAAALTAAAGLAETIAQELRLTLPDGPRDRDTTAADEWEREAGVATEVIAPEEAPDVVERPDVVESSFVDDSLLERSAFSEGQAPRAVPGEPVSVLDDEPDAEALPEEELLHGATGLSPMPPETVLDDESSPIPPAPGVGDAMGDAPEPWAEDVAATVAEGTVREAIERLPELTAAQLRALERYERSNRSRVTLLRAIDLELAVRG